jgi:uncharacterized delta-60 repeat protein
MKLVRLAFALLALTLLLAEGATAKPGALDRSFGDRGRSVLRLGSPEGPEYPQSQLAAAAARGGRIAVAAGTHVVLLADGRPLRSFGGDGRVAIAALPDTRFLFGDVAIDSRGRVLVAGTLESTLGPSSPGPPVPPPAEFGIRYDPAPGPPAAWAAVYRFLPNGSPDQGFGNGGSVVSEFGQTPPSSYPGGPFPYPTAAVKVRGLAVDGEDRPVLAGTSADRVSTCNYLSRLPDYPTRTWVARLTAAGTPDPEFGEAGVYNNPGAEDPDNLALASNGKILFSNPTEERCPRIAAGKDEVVDFLGATGRAARVSFVAPVGPNGVTTTVRSLAVDSRNRVLVLLADYQRERGGEVVATRVRRLRADGQLDAGFGQNGTAATGLWREGLGTMALDSRGRILVTALGKTGNRIVLARLGTRGKPDRGFGRQGRTSLGWGAKPSLAGPEVLADGDGVVVLAPIGSPNREVSKLVAIARFQGR